MTPKYPNITVKLVGRDRNAFAILWIVAKEMRRAKLPEEEIDTFMKEAMAGDYDELLSTTMKWMEVT